ncbi:hypothetical protein MMC06_001577 [Schaereria dolodes]|nr:hypothetical protein [Schaereria dolodes]
MGGADKGKKDSSSQSNREGEKTSPPTAGTTNPYHRAAVQSHHRHQHSNNPSDPPSNTKSAPDSDDAKDSQTDSNAETTQPLAPPPRPGPTQHSAAESSDYFSSVHNNSHFSLEPNPFEQSFGNPSTETPGKSLLPPVAALASPAPLTGGASLAGGYSWSNSLRSGPLSPAMLSGPTGGDYFDSHLRGGFPTPNESSLRTGLTPGGGGSMFPAPSPNSQALFGHLASGGATPSTIDFHRTAMNAAASRKLEGPNALNGAKSQPLQQRAQVANMDHSSQQAQQHFGQHDNDAANGLFLLAQAGNETQSNNQFAIPNQPVHGLPMQNPSQAPSPVTAKRPARNANGSMEGSLSGSVRGVSEMSGEMSDGADMAKPNTRAKGKRASAGKGAANGRRKAEDAPTKQPAAKKAKNNVMSAPPMSLDGMESDEEQNIKEEQYHENGKKMTDEEKRKNFLERNRVAALKCRQRKKQWLANLQAKVEIFSSENDALSAQVTQLREEILNLKTILIAHKDCPIAQSQGVNAFIQHNQPGEYNNHANPYGMAMQNGQQVMTGPRRYS